MQHVRIGPNAPQWKVLAQTPRSQAAVMVLLPGEHTGDSDNKHATSDQWLFVVEGHGVATVQGSRIELSPGDLLLIEATESHRIDAAADEALRTLNVYSPPAY